MKKTSKVISILLIIAVMLSLCFSGMTVNAAYTPDFEVNSQTALLIDMDTEKVIYAKNPDVRSYPASLAKIMTCLLTLENVPDQELATRKMTAAVGVYNDLYLQGASDAGVVVGEEVTVIDLLHGLMLKSGCETALILADNIGQGEDYRERVDNFVQMMNDKAKEIGCSENTHFANPHGLHDDTQTTTANDLWKILKYTIEKYDRFLEISTKKSYTMSATNKHESERIISHTNSMMFESWAGVTKYYSPYVKGIKTGTTDESGKNLVSMGTDKGMTYLLITMKAAVIDEKGERITDNLSFLDHKNIYNWVFQNFELKTVLKKESIAAQIKVTLAQDKDTLLLNPGEDVISLLPQNVDISSVQKIPHIAESIEAPVEKGQQIGTMDLKLNDEIIATVPLIAAETIERSSFLYAMEQVKGFLGSGWFKGALIVIAVFLVVYISLIVYYNKNKKRRNRRVQPRRPL